MDGERGDSLLAGENEGKICPECCLQAHESCLDNTRLGTGFKSGLLFNYEVGQNTVTQRALFYNPRSLPVLIYSIASHRLNIYICYVYKRKDSTKSIYRNETSQEPFEND